MGNKKKYSRDEKGRVNLWVFGLEVVSKTDTNGVFESALEGDLEEDQNLTRVGRAAPLLFLLDRSDEPGGLVMEFAGRWGC